MNKDANPRYTPQSLINFAGVFVAAVLFAVYIYIYQQAPFNDPWNNVALNIITALSALLAAGVATAVYLHYHPGDFPRKVWLNLMIGSWFWFFGEAVWGVFAYLWTEVPTPSIADAGWIGGLLFFTFALYHQYLIIFPAYQQKIIGIAAGAWVVALTVPAVALLAIGAFEWGIYIDYYYPIAELAMSIAGVALVVAFQGGALMRPWIGLFIFGVSDFFYAWAEQFGLYEWSAANNSLLTLAIDASYLAAYLILGVGFLAHWILINYGLRDKRAKLEQ
jgi:hypothetical protein